MERASVLASASAAQNGESGGGRGAGYLRPQGGAAFARIEDRAGGGGSSNPPLVSTT